MPATSPTTVSASTLHVPVWGWPVAALAAAFFANAVPHTLAGPLILNLPTPFSGGPGTLSSPLVNVLWGLSNIAIGWLLLTRVRPWHGDTRLRWTMVVTAVAFAIFLTWAIGSQPLPGRFI